MKKLFCILIILYFTCLMVGCNNKNQQLTEIPIDKDNVLSIIEDLTSEKYKGRLTGTLENLQVGDYISQYFANINLKKPNDFEDYKQWYQQKTRLIHSAPELSIINNQIIEKTFNYLEDFVVQTSPNQRLSGEVISNFIVIENESSLPVNYNETILIKIDVFNNLILKPSFIQSLGKLKGIILAVNNSDAFGVSAYVLEEGQYINENVPFVVNVNMNVYNELKTAAEENKSIKIEADFSIDEVNVPNIIGLIEGTSDEVLIIGAHFDHVGDNLDGTYNPGALDNASGVSTMMEIARIIKEFGRKPKKTIVFVAFNGEEQMLFGSKYYVSRPLFPLDKTKMINIDTVGSKENIPLRIEGYDDTNSQLIQDFINAAEAMNLNYQVGTSNGSDHSSFGKENVEVINLIHPDFKNGYHSPLDTVEKIDFLNLEKVIELIIKYININLYQ